MTEYTAFRIVRGLTVARMFCALLLPICGWMHLWALAAVLFVGGFLTDAIDGSLARYWGVTTKSGERLDTSADAILTIGGLLAATIGGIWHVGALASLGVGFVTICVIEPDLWQRHDAPKRLSGDSLGFAMLSLPAANFLLVALLAAHFIEYGISGNYGQIIFAEIACGAVIAYCKREQIADFLCLVIQRSLD